ncbi:uncharacterized protein LOC128254460 [Drosophila gunungcola]|uniref:Uncharacterized protein n=1 Tax=Drosophila gunungcola TaxID=103775 RepID=A0A9P9YMJ6_9MUSC|nr:uncharacterized protein LOC128254460 [Drosophila gunungcola]XP_052839549.1 uncharacterized protein LOC128254460 [Drosophila gunungcola]KAI8039768.1 hypothetical protein M5D96_007190 [Drosophila gunungcola]
MAASSKMELEDNSDSSTSSQISECKDSNSALGSIKNERESFYPFKLFYRDFGIWEGRKPDKKLRKKALKAWHNLEPAIKLHYLIMTRVKMTEERKFRALAVKKKTKDKTMQTVLEGNDKIKPMRRVIIVEPSWKSVRPRMVTRKPTPLPSAKKRMKNRLKTLPKFVPFSQRKIKPNKGPAKI